MAQVLESLMLICFGISWPISILKSWRSRTSKGKSLIFLCFILVGYACGIAAKITAGKITYVLFFYGLNFILVSIDAILYIRNSRLDREREQSAAGE